MAREKKAILHLYALDSWIEFLAVEQLRAQFSTPTEIAMFL